jgi:hypothetical protein
MSKGGAQPRAAARGIESHSSRYSGPVVGHDADEPL